MDPEKNAIINRNTYKQTWFVSLFLLAGSGLLSLFARERDTHLEITRETHTKNSATFFSLPLARARERGSCSRTSLNALLQDDEKTKKVRAAYCLARARGEKETKNFVHLSSFSFLHHFS